MAGRGARVERGGDGVRARGGFLNDKSELLERLWAMVAPVETPDEVPDEAPESRGPGAGV